MTDVLEPLRAAGANLYEIRDGLGAGGMATVYLAHDLNHDRQVAVTRWDGFPMHPLRGACSPSRATSSSPTSAAASGR